MNSSTVASLGVLTLFVFVFITIYIMTQNILVKPSEIGWLFETVAGPVAIIVAIIIFIYEQNNQALKKRDEDTERIVRSCNSILEEIKDHDTALNTSKHKHVTKPLDKIHYAKAYLNTDAFMSISQSGLFTHFDSDTQNQLSNLYIRINNFNSHGKYKFELEDQYGISVRTSDSSLYYRKRLIKIEQYLTFLQKEIRESLPLVKELIENEKSRPR